MKTSRIALSLISALCVLTLTGCQKKTPDADGGTPPGEEVSKPADFGNQNAGDTNPNPANPMDEAGGPAETLEGNLRPVFFAFDKYDLTQESRDTLTGNARVLRETPGFDIIVEGHCDERGTNEYNLALGDRRARAARDFLVSSGIPASRFTIVSYGEERPFAYGHEEASWSQNRRAHFRVARR